MLALEHRWALGHEPIVEVPHSTWEGVTSPPAGHAGLPLACAGGLKGIRIVNLQRELLGHLEEIMLDVHHGRIAYAVMGAGGFLGLGERYFAIPWSALVMAPERECLVLDVARERFDQPTFTGDTAADELPWAAPAEPAARHSAWPRWE
ncbi:MAG: PRC-barrel domain-containing protein [Pseudomonadota bacterium]